VIVIQTRYVNTKSLKTPKEQSETVYRRTGKQWPIENVQKDKQISLNR